MLKNCFSLVSAEGIFTTEKERSRKKTEEKAKVVAAVWGTEFIQFHAALQI